MNLQSEISAARKIFFVTGFGLASWAPFIPIVQNILQLNDGAMGSILLAFGLGSILMMSLSGAMVEKFGCRSVYIVFLVLFILSLFVIVISNSLLISLIALFLFGAGIGGADVVININAVALQKKANKPVMSGLHALFSLGGISGALFVSCMLYFGIPAIYIVLMIFILFVILINTSITNISGPVATQEDQEKVPFFIAPKGIVVVIAIVCLIAFLVEGAILDWSGIFLINRYDININHAGIGYIIFAVFMTLGRVFGDKAIGKFGYSYVMNSTILILILGLSILIASYNIYISYFAFGLIGLGLANIAPIVFSAAGKQTDMNESSAVSSVATIGYSGILLGPAVIGFIAHISSLVFSFAFVALLVLSMLIMTIKFKFTGK